MLKVSTKRLTVRSISLNRMTSINAARSAILGICFVSSTIYCGNEKKEDTSYDIGVAVDIRGSDPDTLYQREWGGMNWEQRPADTKKEYRGACRTGVWEDGDWAYGTGGAMNDYVWCQSSCEGYRLRVWRGPDPSPEKPTKMATYCYCIPPEVLENNIGPYEKKYPEYTTKNVAPLPGTSNSGYINMACQYAWQFNCCNTAFGMPKISIPWSERDVGGHFDGGGIK